jgi:hypothetical protein
MYFELFWKKNVAIACDDLEEGSPKVSGEPAIF